MSKLQGLQKKLQFQGDVGVFVLIKTHSHPSPVGTLPSETWSVPERQAFHMTLRAIKSQQNTPIEEFKHSAETTLITRSFPPLQTVHASRSHHMAKKQKISLCIRAGGDDENNKS